MMILITIKMVCWTVYHYDFDYCLKNVCLHAIIFARYLLEIFRCWTHSTTMPPTKSTMQWIKNQNSHAISVSSIHVNSRLFHCCIWFWVDFYERLNKIVFSLSKRTSDALPTFKCFIYEQAGFPFIILTLNLLVF